MNPLDFEISFYEGIVKDKPDFLDALMLLAEAYTAKGHYQKGLDVDRRLATLRPEDPTVRYNLACSLALVGKKEDALLELEHSVRLGYRDFEHLRRDSDLKTLHADPRFQLLFGADIQERV